MKLLDLASRNIKTALLIALRSIEIVNQFINYKHIRVQQKLKWKIKKQVNTYTSQTKAQRCDIWIPITVRNLVEKFKEIKPISPRVSI